MSLRVRANGELLCAAKHPALPDDLRYIDDGLHYILAAEQRVLIPNHDEAETGKWHWRNMGEDFRKLSGDAYYEDPVTAFGYDEDYWGKPQP